MHGFLKTHFVKWLMNQILRSIRQMALSQQGCLLSQVESLHKRGPGLVPLPCFAFYSRKWPCFISISYLCYKHIVDLTLLQIGCGTKKLWTWLPIITVYAPAPYSVFVWECVYHPHVKSRGGDSVMSISC